MSSRLLAFDLAQDMQPAQETTAVGQYDVEQQVWSGAEEVQADGISYCTFAFSVTGIPTCVTLPGGICFGGEFPSPDGGVGAECDF